MFTRKHYKQCAQEVKKFLQSPESIQPIDLVSLFVTLFKPDNERFDERKFVEACGLTWEEYHQD